jgi:hypothetical protein
MAAGVLLPSGMAAPCRPAAASAVRRPQLALRAARPETRTGQAVMGSGVQQLVTGRDVWPRLVRLCKQARWRQAAIAYLTAPALLPFTAGDLLVVDATPASVAAGSTSPTAIGQLLRRDVDVRSLPGLHAKILLTDRHAAVGSANASTHSRDRLHEAVLVTTERAVRAAVREDLERLAADATALDLGWVRRAKPLFATARPPRPPIAAALVEPAGLLPVPVRRLVISSGETFAPDPSSRLLQQLDAARRIDRRTRHPQPALSYDIARWDGSPIRPGDLICWHDPDSDEVAPPVHVVTVLPSRSGQWLSVLTDATLPTVGLDRLRAAATRAGHPLRREVWLRDPTLLRALLRAFRLRPTLPTERDAPARSRR